jgi:hypothetical protein
MTQQMRPEHSEKCPDRHARQRKPSRGLQWRIPTKGGDPVWSDAAELKAALERLLDTDDKRAAASRLVLGWQMLQAAGDEDASLAEAAAIVQAKNLHPGIQRLITVAAELKAQATTVVAEVEDPEIRVLCAALVVHSQRDVAQLLWAADGNSARMEG